MIPLKSKEIVERFVDSGETYETIIPPVGRSKISVYNALLAYVKRHEDLGVSVRFVRGEIIMVNNEKHNPSVRP